LLSDEMSQWARKGRRGQPARKGAKGLIIAKGLELFEAQSVEDTVTFDGCYSSAANPPLWMDSEGRMGHGGHPQTLVKTIKNRRV